MNPGANPFDPFGFFSAGRREGNPFDLFALQKPAFAPGNPFALWQMGFQMMQAWQNACMPLMTALLPGALPRSPMLAPFSGAFAGPFAALLPRVEARISPVRGASGDEEATRLSMRVQVPGVPGTLNDERIAVEALIAREQGRESAWLGCLKNANLVFPESTDAPAESGTAPVSVVGKVTARARRGAAPKTAGAPAKKAPVKTAAVGAKPVAAKKPAASKAATGVAKGAKSAPTKAAAEGASAKPVAKRATTKK